MTNRLSRFLLATTAGMLFTLSACGGDKGAATDSAQPAAGTATDANAGASAGGAQQLTPDAGGKVIDVQMLTDEQGNNKFDPAKFDAAKGDVIRYHLKTGVHNVHFLPDSNPGKTGLPAASELLQLPGQTHDVKVSFEPGTYYFQCDPHARLGMVGHVTVK
jgi:plastocyanin